MTTSFAISTDGTRIAYEVRGNGPPLLLVDGAMCSRGFGPAGPLAALLTQQFSVVLYDRRGRGESGDTQPYAAEREIEDLHAIAAAIGKPLFVYGTSSGAVLVARAVAAGLPATRLVLHEPPLALDGTHHPNPADYREQCAALVAHGRRGDAVKLFMRVVGMPGFAVFIMGLLPMFKKITAVAHTLPYDFAILGDTQSGGPMPAELVDVLARVRLPAVVLIGGKSPPWMHHAVQRVHEEIAGSRVELLPGQQHNVSPKSVAPVLLAHFV